MADFRSNFRRLYDSGRAIKTKAAETEGSAADNQEEGGNNDAALEKIIRQLEEIEAAVRAERDRFRSTEREVRSEASSLGPDSDAARREIERAIREAGKGAQDRETLQGEIRAAIEDLRNGTANKVSGAVSKKGSGSDMVSASSMATNDYSSLSRIEPETLESRIGGMPSQPSMENALLADMLLMQETDEWKERYGSNLDAEKIHQEQQVAMESQRRQQYFYHHQRHLRSEPPSWVAYRTVEDQYRSTYWKITY